MSPHHSLHQFPAALPAGQGAKTGIEEDCRFIVRNFQIHDKTAVKTQTAKPLLIERESRSRLPRQRFHCLILGHDPSPAVPPDTNIRHVNAPSSTRLPQKKLINPTDGFLPARPQIPPGPFSGNARPGPERQADCVGFPAHGVGECRRMRMPRILGNTLPWKAEERKKKNPSRKFRKGLIFLVGMARFERAISASRTQRSTRLSHIPLKAVFLAHSFPNDKSLSQKISRKNTDASRDSSSEQGVRTQNCPMIS